MIPDKIPDFLGTRIRLFGIPTLPDSEFLLSDLFDTRLFATRSTTNASYVMLVSICTYFVGHNTPFSLEVVSYPQMIHRPPKVNNRFKNDFMTFSKEGKN